MIRLFETVITDDDRKAVADATDAYTVRGRYQVQSFEEELAAFLGRQYVVCTNSGTSALMAAIACTSVPGSVCGFPAYTHPAGANAARLLGRPVTFYDVESPERPTMRPIEPFLEDDDPRAQSPSPSFVIYVNHNGVGSLQDFCRARPEMKPVIADCSQAFGCNNSGSAAAWTYSFSPHKLITTGQGGCVATDSAEIAQSLYKFVDQSRPRKRGDEPGVNLRMSSMQAALGRSQLRRADELIDRKLGIAHRYRRLGLHCPDIPWCLLYRTENAATLLERLANDGVDSAQLYRAIPQASQWDVGDSDRQFPQAALAEKELLYLPAHPNLKRHNIEYIARMLEKHDR